jgi:hypothetical protein
LVAGLTYSGATLAAFFFSVTVGLFGFQERFRGPWQERAAIIEALAMLLFATLVTTHGHRYHHPNGN